MEDTISIGDERVPARWAESWLEQTRGHMFRRERPDYALVFPREDVESWSLHMLFVPFALDVAFVVDGVVQHVDRLQPWRGYATGRADTVIELPAGEVDVRKGDTVEVEGW